MECQTCGSSGVVTFAVPDTLVEFAPGDAVSVCRHCLTVEGIDDVPGSQPDPKTVSDALPDDPNVALAVLLAGSLMGSLALNRSKVETVLSQVEEAGVDPHLVFERLMDDPEVDPAVALTLRYRQLEQLRG